MAMVPAPAGEPVSYARRIADLAAADGDRIAARIAKLDGTDVEITWHELHRRSSQVAHALRREGLSTGDRLAVGIANSAELLFAVLGAWKLGVTPVPLRWDLPDWEQRRVLDVISAPVELLADGGNWIAATTDEDADELPDVVAPFTHGICSSGSTGTPKVILLARPGTWDPTIGAPFPVDWIDVPLPQRVLVPAPFYHTNGFLSLYNLLAGDELVILAKFDARRVVDLIERLRVSAMTATPTMLQRIADVPGIDGRDLSSLVWVNQGAAAIPPSLVHRWIALVGADRFFMSYGMTEGMGLTSVRADDWLHHPGTVGRGYRQTEIVIKDDAGAPVGPDVVGEIWMRSPSTGMYRYLGDGPAQRDSDSQGYSTGGDLGHLDADGYLYIADRRVDLIVTGGANVFPAEVENALIDHPKIADVVVIGLPDPAWGHRVHAIVEPAEPTDPPTEGEVISYAKSRLAAYKVPKTVELIASVPRTEATKVSRSALVAERT